MSRFAILVVVPLAGCGALLGTDEDPTPPSGDARSDGGDGGDGSSSADVTTAEGGFSAETGADGAGGTCGAPNASCTDTTQCCSGLDCVADGTRPKATDARCCAQQGGPCTTEADCCVPPVSQTITCDGNPGQMTCIVVVN